MAKRDLPYGGSAVPMDPGERNKAVTILELTEAAGSSGFPVESWESLAETVWMRRIESGARERMVAEGLGARVDVRWEMCYRADMDPELVDVPKLRRLSYQGRVFDITGASVIGWKAGIELLTIARSGS